MADRTVIDATIDRYYQAWVDHDHELYRTVWGANPTFADPPEDNIDLPRGFDAIAAAMDDVWSRATSITYDRHMMWHCGSAVAVHVTVTMLTAEGAELKVPLIHVFRCDPGGLIDRLEAFLDLTLAEVVSGDTPAWMEG